MSANRSLRQRAVDTNRPMPVVCEGGAARPLAAAATAAATAAQEAASKERENELSNIAIPTPDVGRIEHYLAGHAHARAKLAPHYIHFHLWTGARVVPPTVVYDLTLDDMEWCQQLEDNSKPAEPSLTLDQLEYLMDAFEKRAGRKTRAFDCEHVFSKDDAVQAFGAELARGSLSDNDEVKNISTEAVKMVYEYWINKRRKLGKALMRVFQEAPAYDDPSPHVAFRPRERERRISTRNPRKNDTAALEKMKALKRDLHTTMELIELVEKREAMKSDQVQLDAEIFDAQLAETVWAARVRDLKHKWNTHSALLASTIPRTSFAEDVLERRRERKRLREKLKRDRLKPDAAFLEQIQQPNAALRHRKAREVPRFVLPVDLLPFDISESDPEPSSEEGETDEDRAFFKQLQLFVDSEGATPFEKMAPSRPLPLDPMPDHMGQLVFRYGRLNRLIMQPMYLDKSGFARRHKPVKIVQDETTASITGPPSRGAMPTAQPGMLMDLSTDP